MKHAFIATIFLLSFAASLRAQTEGPRFEVASVKLNPTPGPVIIHFGPERVSLTSVDLQIALMLAYDVSGFRIEGPDFVSSGLIRFNLEAKASHPVSEDQLRLMLRPLLADRFHLTLHDEQREMPVIALRPARSGDKLKQSAGNAPPDTRWLNFAGVSQTFAQGHHIFVNAPMDAIATAVGACTGSSLPPVIDQTGLKGRFDFTLRNLPPPPPDTPAPTEDDKLAACDLIVQQDLGLTLSRAKAPVDILVIDHADKVPTEN